MDLILLPVAASCLVIGGMLISSMIGGAMLLNRRTSRAGKKILLYSECALAGGLACFWLGFFLMRLLGPLESHWVQWGNVNLSPPLVVFWASGPFGMALGVVLARRLREGQRGREGRKG